MTDEGVRHFFARIPGMHGLTEAALSGWSGTVRILPAGAVLTVGDFMICGGEPGEHGRQTLACMMAEQPREWLLYVPGKWKALLDGLGMFRPVTRQGFQLLQPDAIREDLVGWKSLPPGYSLAFMDRADAEACLTADWSRDFVREHGSVEQFLHRGMGILVRDAAGRPAAGASAYVSWPWGLEVQLQTRQDQEGKGLATAAAAALLQAARYRGMAVAWDAANAASAHIARKLGFIPGEQYTVWERLT